MNSKNPFWYPWGATFAWGSLMLTCTRSDETDGALVMLLMAAPALSSVSLAAYGCDTPNVSSPAFARFYPAVPIAALACPSGPLASADPLGPCFL